MVITVEDSKLRYWEENCDWISLVAYFWNMFTMGSKTQRHNAARQYDFVITNRARRVMEELGAYPNPG